MMWMKGEKSCEIKQKLPQGRPQIVCLPQGVTNAQGVAFRYDFCDITSRQNVANSIICLAILLRNRSLCLRQTALRHAAPSLCVCVTSRYARHAWRLAKPMWRHISPSDATSRPPVWRHAMPGLGDATPACVTSHYARLALRRVMPCLASVT